MHHCIYTNYGHQLKHGKYIAFHVKSSNPYTVMFYMDYADRWKFSQAYHAWNKPLTEEEMNEAMSLIEHVSKIKPDIIDLEELLKN